MIELVTTRAQLERCWAIRFAVFVDEQQVPLDEEVDQLDTAPSTIHLLAVVDGKDVGTLRILPEEAGHCHIGRVAVSDSHVGRAWAGSLWTAPVRLHWSAARIPLGGYGSNCLRRNRRWGSTGRVATRS